MQHFRRREAGIDLDAQRLGLGRQPAGDPFAQGADIVAVVVHQLRHGEIGQADPARRAEKKKLVFGDLRLQRGIRNPSGPCWQKAHRGPPGSITAPERICAPISAPFSTTTTE